MIFRTITISNQHPPLRGGLVGLPLRGGLVGLLLRGGLVGLLLRGGLVGLSMALVSNQHPLL